jgi:hypothetical protein
MRKSDLRQVNKWLESQNMTPRAYVDFPIRSFIVPGVAIACVRDCEGGYGMMDSVATNPLVSSGTRHKASLALWNKILSIEDFKTIVGFTTDAGTLERALRHGFREITTSVLVHSQEA